MSSRTSSNPAVGSPAAAASALPERHVTALRSYLQHLTRQDQARVESVMGKLLRDGIGPGVMDPAEDPVVGFFIEARRLVHESGFRGEAQAEPAAGEGEVAEGEDPRVAVHQAIQRLTPKQEEALRLKFQFGFSLEELTRITHMSHHTASGLLHLAVTRVGQAICAAKGLAVPSVDDQRLTAYALDEMDAAEKSSFMRSFPSSKTLLESTEAIRAWGGQITEVLAKGAPMTKRRRSRGGAAWWRSGWLWLGVAVAAGIAVAGYYFRQPSAAAATSWQASGVNGLGSLPSEIERERKNRMGSGGVVITSAGKTSNPGRVTTDEADRADPKRSVSLKAKDRAPGATEKRAGAAPVPDEAPERDAKAKPRGAPMTPVSRIKNPATPRGQAEAGTDFSPEAVHKGTMAPSAATDEDTNAPTPADPAAPAARPSGASPDAKAPAQPRERKAEANAADEAGEDPLKVNLNNPAKPPTADQAKKRPTGKRSAGPAVPLTPADVQRLAPPPAAAPGQSQPVEAKLEQAPSPWDPAKRIVRVSLRAKDAPSPARPAANLVFAIDVSQSMSSQERLQLVEAGIRGLLERLRPEDRVAIVTYADRAELALGATTVNEAAAIRSCLAGLATAGRTNGSDGLMLGYEVVKAGWIEGGRNELVLCTDGNFNLGTTDDRELAALAAEKARGGMRLSVIGFGRNDRNDLRLELLAAAGGGLSGYVNNPTEAERMLVAQVNGLFPPVATDVTLQVEFSPASVVAARRLENADDPPADGTTAQLLPGRRVAALYEVTPRDASEAAELQVRLTGGYTLTAAGETRVLDQTLRGPAQRWPQTAEDFRFVTALTEFARILRHDPAARGVGLDRLNQWVSSVLPDDTGGYRSELLYRLDEAKFQAETVGVP